MTMTEYIDRDAFKESVEERYCLPCKEVGKDYNGCRCRACWVDDMLDEIDCFQPADVAPVRHGRWIYKGDSDMWVCSRCGRGVIPNPEGIDLYCYHCGAKMDESEDKNEIF